MVFKSSLLSTRPKNAALFLHPLRLLAVLSFLTTHALQKLIFLNIINTLLQHFIVVFCARVITRLRPGKFENTVQEVDKWLQPHLIPNNQKSVCNIIADLASKFSHWFHQLPPHPSLSLQSRPSLLTHATIESGPSLEAAVTRTNAGLSNWIFPRSVGNESCFLWVTSVASW